MWRLLCMFKLWCEEQNIVYWSAGNTIHQTVTPGHWAVMSFIDLHPAQKPIYLLQTDRAKPVEGSVLPVPSRVLVSLVVWPVKHWPVKSLSYNEVHWTVLKWLIYLDISVTTCNTMCGEHQGMPSSDPKLYQTW